MCPINATLARSVNDSIATLFYFFPFFLIVKRRENTTENTYTRLFRLQTTQLTGAAFFHRIIVRTTERKRKVMISIENEIWPMRIY